MKILGVDPGTARMGWSVVIKEKSTPKLVSYGCIETEKTLSVEGRLLILYNKAHELFSQYLPDVVAVEDLFFTKNAKTAITVAQARGVMLLVAGQKNIPVVSYSPLTIKNAIAGYGKADKRQVQQMVSRILKLEKIPKPDDAADAIAVALTHCFTNKFGQIL